MDLAKKTTILFPPDLHRRLTALARERHSSVGELVREACQRQYSMSRDDRLAALAELQSLRLPAGSPAQMKQRYQDLTAQDLRGTLTHEERGELREVTEALERFEALEADQIDAANAQGRAGKLDAALDRIDDILRTWKAAAGR